MSRRVAPVLPFASAPVRTWVRRLATAATPATFARAATFAGAATVATFALAAAAPGPSAARVELLVRLVVLPDGTVRFGVPVRVDGQVVEAGLDTGSTGLRVMARALPPGGAAGATVHYGYGSGTVLTGPEVTARVAFGAGEGAPVRVQRVEALSCMASRPRCPVTRNADPATFGIQGDGYPGLGFAAILGVNLRGASQPNPFEALGVRRWIVELPRPGEGGAGRIVLNPDAAETAGYRAVRFLTDDNSVPACIAGAPPLGSVCGTATIDSGAPGLRIVQAAAHGPVPPGTAATIAVGTGDGAVTWPVATERRDQGSHLAFEHAADAGRPRLFLGVAPYYAFSILYDADARTVGFKPR